ncbi:uncharacterized protein LOC143681021 [Tamandua tetradactyla]|uniref:uncharacterized protein LOC143681021 n=1 Tax=Tamandua tetradactyla TaxID=48850 RepID=UPI0040540E9C
MEPIRWKLDISNRTKFPIRYLIARKGKATLRQLSSFSAGGAPAASQPALLSLFLRRWHSRRQPGSPPLPLSPPAALPLPASQPSSPSFSAGGTPAASQPALLSLFLRQQRSCRHLALLFPLLLRRRSRHHLALLFPLLLRRRSICHLILPLLLLLRRLSNHHRALFRLHRLLRHRPRQPCHPHLSSSRTATGGVETIQSSSWSHDGDQRDGIPHPGTADCLGEPAPENQVEVQEQEMSAQRALFLIGPLARVRIYTSPKITLSSHIIL